MIDDILLEAEEKMDKAVEAASHEFSNIRTGRATSSIRPMPSASTCSCTWATGRTRSSRCCSWTRSTG